MDLPPTKAMKEAERDQRNNIVKARASTNRVIISIYAESPRKRLQQKHDPTPKKSTRTRGYDRRAQLLAYASELRCVGSEPMEWSRRNSRPNLKKWKWSSAPARIRESFLRMFQQKERQWGYERIVTEENGEADPLSEEIDVNDNSGIESTNNGAAASSPPKDGETPTQIQPFRMPTVEEGIIKPNMKKVADNRTWDNNSIFQA
ncbi:unnamed protein product [Dovyalis caffra]|uniref:Uncharacterized protein n=1 Tax=Dovyalis caffra TaxID=77055 RepID=A0AAV1S6F3_9ROSI|nr:unnamed protein product [Dovyalis caffra]